MAIAAAVAASDKLAKDILVLEVGDLISITEYFVIASGANDRQVKAIGESVQEALRAFGEKPVRREGEREMHWLLLDYADIVVHVFREEDRAYYELERLWRDAPVVAWDEPQPATRAR